MNIIILGPPGSGKGTISKYLKRKYGIKHISTGDLFRNEIKSRSELGRRIKPIIEAGNFVEDEVVVWLVWKCLRDLKVQGYILDGYPRNLYQAELLENMLKGNGKKVDLVLYLDTKEKIIVERLSARRQCSQCARIHGLNIVPKKEGVCNDCGGKLFSRADDAPEVVRKRYKIYLNETKPLIKFYKTRRLLKKVNVSRELPVIYEDISKIVEKKDKGKRLTKRYQKYVKKVNQLFKKRKISILSRN